MHIVLFEPEIPPNTGNIIRLCANTGMELHIIEPMAFTMDDKKLRRAGLDYHEFSKVKIHGNLEHFLSTVDFGQLYTISTKGNNTYTEIDFQANDAVMFGPETRGLPQEVREKFGAEHCLVIPMLAESRSLNLSNATAIIVYEAWRQQGFNSAV